MRKRILALLLAGCCTLGTMTTAFAVQTEEGNDPNRVVEYCEEDDPMARPRSEWSEDAESDIFHAENRFSGAEVGSNRSPYTSPFKIKSQLSDGTKAEINRTYMLPSGYNVYNGIDVSYHNKDINWQTAKNAGVDFAIIRAGYRGYGTSGSLAKDPKFDTNMRGAAAAGIPVGVYIYSQALNEAEAIAEAQFVLNQIGGYDVQLEIVMDYEFFETETVVGRLAKAYKERKLTKEIATANALAFCKTISDAGYKPMVYANKSFFQTVLDADAVSSVSTCWLAHYLNKQSSTYSSYAGEYDYWQYSESAVVPGMGSQYTDVNFYITKGTLPQVDGDSIPDESTPDESTPDESTPDESTPDESTPDDDSSMQDTNLSGVFTDVFHDWAYDYIAYVYHNGLMKGMGDGTFQPNAKLTRAEAVQLIYNYESMKNGTPAQAGNAPFGDVPNWAKNAVNWAYAAGVAAGESRTSFGADKAVTRQDFMTMLCRYLYNGSIPAQNDVLSGCFSDANSVSSYAKDALNWAVANKIISGMGDGTLSPKSNTLRAQAAVILTGFAKYNEPENTPE